MSDEQSLRLLIFAVCFLTVVSLSATTVMAPPSLDHTVTITRTHFSQNGDEVNYNCSSKTSEEVKSWMNNGTRATLCSCINNSCLITNPRYTCFANEKMIILRIEHFSSDLDNFPLLCQLGSYTSVFERESELSATTVMAPPSRNTGSFKHQNSHVGAIVAGSVGYCMLYC